MAFIFKIGENNMTIKQWIIERKIKTLQARVQKWENRQKQIAKWIKEDKKEIKRLMSNEADRIISKSTHLSIKMCKCGYSKETDRKCTNCGDKN